ncbi:cache domain-containing sensor histidine kinase [Hungatella effluvii]|uniref:cache domain-containing sensor histidine kinase n=1 Tax=Hungatella effluvii TaxID=1096246 RepID=UPI002A81BA0F|nr:histidine kinase [Hungatella effluvii]
MKSQIRWGTFFKLSLVVVSSIVLTNFCTIASSDWITKNLFIQSSTFLNAKLMDNIKKKVEENNNSYLMLLRLLETKPALKNYFLAADSCGTEKFIKTYDILKVYHDSVPSGTAQNLVAVSNQGSAFSFTGERISVPVEEIETMPCSLKISETSRRLQYTYQDHGITDDFKDRKCVIAARRLFLPSSSESFATAYITIPEEEFYQMFSEAVPEGSRMVILSSDGQIVSGNVKDSLGSEETKLLSLVRSMRENEDTYRTVKENHKPEIVISGYIPELDMYMVNTVEEAALLKSYAGVRRNILVTGFLITGTAIAVVFLIMRRIVSPLNFFIQQLETFKNRRFEKVSLVKGNSEVRQMADVYNRMVDEIDSYVKQLMEEQERGRRLEIEALQMQINPHFMYNTLASIKYLTWENNTEKASDTINALIAILKKTIGNMEEEITLREEIDLVRQYVFINQVRYGDRIEVEYFLAEEGMECMVPKLILQPFIENAFFHAFQNKKEGKIRIFAKKQRDDLICEIIDEGDGMSQEETADLLSSDRRRHLTGIGIPNVHERLRLIYGEEYGVTIHSVIGTGTSVSLRLPYHLKKLPKL